MCKNTLGHDGHRAVELSDQARKDSDYIRALNEHADQSMEQIHQKVNNIRVEEQILIRIRKDIHKVGELYHFIRESLTVKNIGFTFLAKRSFV